MHANSLAMYQVCSYGRTGLPLPTALADLEPPKGLRVGLGVELGLGLSLGSGWFGPTCKVEVEIGHTRFVPTCA